MELAQKQQIEFYLMNAVQRANEFFDLGQQKELEYWRGQVLGAVKVIKTMNLNIETTYWLNQLP
jgi:hypothetical protein